MKVTPVPPPVEEAAVAVVPKVSIGAGWVAALEPRERGALVRLHSADRGTVNVEIVLTAEGPMIRASVGALEIAAESDVRVSCDRFLVEARKSFAVSAADVAVTAREGEVAIRANDDVSVHGEQVLLNCDRDPPVPSWLPAPAPVQATLPASAEHGDADLLRDLAKE